jgi:anthranilate phosphoribosyltransferase
VSTQDLALAIRALATGRALDAEATAAAFDVLMRGDATAAQTAALLMGLRVRGETAETVAGAARALRRVMHSVVLADPETIVDTCGTGGGVLSTFNISTAAALLAVGAGARVAKHGNRSFTSSCGSADVLEALGIAIELPLTRLPEVFAATGIVFMFAPLMHPAMRHVAPVRRELAITTVMNIVGPLANPAHVGRQVIGVSEPDKAPLLANALLQLGSRRALVVHGAPGIDEISPMGLTDVLEVQHGAVRSWRIDPRDYGFTYADAAELAGGTPAENALMIEQVLGGAASTGAAVAVILNAAAALLVADLVPDYGAGVEVASAALRDGRGLRALDALRQHAPRATAQ